MNTSNIILRLQNILDESDSSLDYQILSKVIEKLKVGKIDVVATFDDLPDNLETDGNVFLVESEEELYYNIDNQWFTIVSVVLPLEALSWGRNNVGQLGDGTTENRSSPVTVIGGIKNWKQVSAGNTHCVGVTTDGIAYAWGENSIFGSPSGQLGDNTSINKSSPVTVVGGITNWKQVSAGSQGASSGITDDGIAYAWGQGGSGQLGDGTTGYRSSPVTVVGGITNWSQVSVGGVHSLGLTDDGIAYAWGYNSDGPLGDGTVEAKSSPVTVVGGITNWSQVSARGTNSLGVTEDGIAYAWGQGGSGQLGDGTTENRSSPVTVIGGITNWSQLSAGFNHSLGVTDDGIAYAWGGNSGQLGDGTTENRSSPVTVIGGIKNWSQVSAGVASLGVTDDGIAYAWGSNSDGRLGDGTTTSKSSPVTVVGGITSWTQVSAGNEPNLGLKSS